MRDGIGWPCSTKHEPSHGVDASDKIQFGEGNRLAMETFRVPIAGTDRESRVVGQRRILDHIEGILVKVVGATKIGSAQIESDAGPPSGPRIEIIVSRIAGQRGPEARSGLVSELLANKQAGTSDTGAVRIGEIQIFRHETNTSIYVFGEPPAEREAGAALFLEIGNVVRHTPEHVDLHGGLRVVQVRIPERDETESPLLTELAANPSHPAIPSQVAFCNIGDRDELIQCAKTTADAELAGGLFFHSYVQVNFIRFHLLGQNFNRLEKIQIVQPLEAPL